MLAKLGIAAASAVILSMANFTYNVPLTGGDNCSNINQDARCQAAAIANGCAIDQGAVASVSSCPGTSTTLVCLCTE